MINISVLVNGESKGDGVILTHIRRLYVRKKEGFRGNEAGVLAEMREVLGEHIKSVAIYHRYDVAHISDENYEKAIGTIFSEPPVDEVTETLPKGDYLVAVELLPGQYDQRADSAEQCLSVLTGNNGASVLCALVYAFTGSFTKEDKEKIVKYLINPVESFKADLGEVDEIDMPWEKPDEVEHIQNFISKDDESLRKMLSDLGLAMSFDDLRMIYDYFKTEEKRDPTITEIRVLDTYWSDHCRHTTFSTKLNDIVVDDGVFTKPIQKALAMYEETRNQIYGSDACRPMTLMDMATIAVKDLKKHGFLGNLDSSEEVNACTIKITVDTPTGKEDWLLLFKNETHNHPTEIEPYGGAATCLGGCIRDPLSGRAYVYQAMRVTGAADPATPLKDTLPGKLPQRKIVMESAKGYSSYGNQIGLATGEVKEYYHPGFMAKRMEIGAVIAATPADHVVRKEPEPGDVIILVGGRTGRDGMGGATGSSKELDTTSIETCGAEVQKGNPLIERKIQCLFRRKEVTRLIKRCNDFGAGGVSVAVGELADSLLINLDKISKKYEGLDGTELAISESQERMACVVRKEDAERFIAYAAEENLEATVIAQVTDSGRLVMTWQGDVIVDISRAFLNTNGAMQETDVHIIAPNEVGYFKKNEIDDIEKTWINVMSDLNTASQQGLAEHFDATIGAGTVLMPFGGAYQKTPTDGMVAKVPIRFGETDTASFMTHGFDPYLATWSPFHGAVYAILLSLTRLVSLGADWRKAYLTLQEYFEKLRDKSTWGKPTAALLGAFYVQHELGIAAIGGKDSMSGTFNDLHVPPSLISFAVAPGKASEAVSQELKEKGDCLILFGMPKDEMGMPDWNVFKKHSDFLYEEVQKGNIRAMKAVGHGGVAATVAEMAFGNHLGVTFSDELPIFKYFNNFYGAIVVETTKTLAEKYREQPHTKILGSVGGDSMVLGNENIPLNKLLKAYEHTFDWIFPREAESLAGTIPKVEEHAAVRDIHVRTKSITPKVFIPTMPGTNCEIDSARAFERAGATTDIFILRNRDAAELRESVQEMVRRIKEAQIIMFPGGFSAGDEPDGSGKFIATVFRNDTLVEALDGLLHQRDGLILGICNGFQALIKLGLVPYGACQPLTKEAPTLTFNTIGRHISRYVTTKVLSNRSPWLSLCRTDELYQIPISHGEGRFIASDEQIQTWMKQGQIATVYTDEKGNISYDSRYNVNGSAWAIEGITDPTGRIFGKMGHSERYGKNIGKNISGNKEQPIFLSGVTYFKG